MNSYNVSHVLTSSPHPHGSAKVEDVNDIELMREVHAG